MLLTEQSGQDITPKKNHVDSPRVLESFGGMIFRQMDAEGKKAATATEKVAKVAQNWQRWH